ncbi:hypothetical protein BDR26DRAFT_853476 [Obelidium mucronatum]|nr:hypothetical protein BDR26DRAFT_853476 [Obelidium mucronatum]
MAQHKQTLIDDATLAFLATQRAADAALVGRIWRDGRHAEFQFRHAARRNAFGVDDIGRREAAAALALTLEKVHADEAAALQLAQSQENESRLAVADDEKTLAAVLREMKAVRQSMDANRAGEKAAKRFKTLMTERRKAAKLYLKRIEEGQDREKKELRDSHNRALKTMSLMRNVALRDVEDAEIRVILKGLDFNSKTAAEEKRNAEALARKEAQVFQEKVDIRLRRNQLEVSHQTEIHTAHLKSISRLVDQEIDYMDENQALLMEHQTKEHELEQELQQKYDQEEEIVRGKILSMEISQAQSNAIKAATSLVERQRKEAQIQKLKEARAAKVRDKEFWRKEEVYLKDHLAGLGLPTEGSAYESVQAILLRQLPADLDKEIPEVEDDLEESGDESPIEASKAIEAAKAREAALLETLRNTHKQLLQAMKKQHKKIRDHRVLEQEKVCATLSGDPEIKKLKEKHAQELKEFDESTQKSIKTDDDNAEGINAKHRKLPMMVSEELVKSGKYEPTDFNELAFLQVHIIDFDDIAMESTASQLVSLINTLEAQIDQVLESSDNIYRLESNDGEFKFVAGLQTQGLKSTKENVLETIQLSKRLIQVFRNLDLTNQAFKKVEPRFGIHIGPATGGVVGGGGAGGNQLQFAILGNTVDVTDKIEKTSRGMEIHISGPAHEVVKEAYEWEVSESVEVLQGGGAAVAKQKVRAWWLQGEKQVRSGLASGSSDLAQ